MSERKALSGLNPEGKKHFRMLERQLRERGVYDPMYDGLLEMAAVMYQEYRDTSAPLKTRLECIKQYQKLVKQLGDIGSIPEKKPEPREDYLEKFMEG